MGNIIDSHETKPVEQTSTVAYPSPSSSTESLDLKHSAESIIIDLDAPEYREYLCHKKLSRSEGNLNEFSYLEWMKTNNKGGSQTNLLNVRWVFGTQS